MTDLKYEHECGFLEGKKEGVFEGRKQGLQEGRKEGLQEGKEEGLREGHKKGISDSLLQLAKEMLADHIPLETISKYSKLSVDEIKKLQ